MINSIKSDHVTHKTLLAYIGVPTGIFAIVVTLVMVIISGSFGSLNQNLIVSKQRNDYQDQRLNLSELANATMKGDLAVIREKMLNMDKNIDSIANAVARIDQRK